MAKGIRIGFGIVGGIIGAAFGSPQIGFALGMMLGGALFGPKAQQSPGSRLEDLSIQGSEYGAPIPILYGGTLGSGLRGGVPTAGQFIDANPLGGIEEVVSGGQKRRGTGGRGGSSGRSADVQEYTYFLTAAIMFCEGTQQLDRFWADETVKYDRYAPNAAFRVQVEPVSGALISENFRFYPGNFKQLPDTALQQFHGGVVPAYRGVTYCVLYKYPLVDHNNRVPNFRALLSNGVTSKREMVRRHMIRAGVPEERIDLCEIRGEIQGAFQTSQGGARDFCEKIAAHSLCELAEFDGKIKDLSKKETMEYDLEYKDLAAHISGQEVPPSMTLSIQQDEDIPSQVSLGFLDARNNWEPNVAIGLGQFEDSRHADLSIEMPIVDTIENMVPLAQIVMDEAIAGRYSGEIALLPKHMKRTVGNVVNVPFRDRTIRMRIASQSMGLPGVISCSLRSYDHKIYPGQRRTVQVPKEDALPVYEGVPKVRFFDIVALADEATTGPMILVGSSPTGSGSNVAIGFDEEAIGSTSIIGRAVMGYNTGAVTPKEDSIIDYDTELTIVLYEGDLGSIEYDDIFTSEANTAVLGQSIIRWLDAEQLTANTFVLRGIMWNQKGSDYVTQIPANSDFMVLKDANGATGSGFTFVQYPEILLGQEVVATFSSAASDAAEETKAITLAGNNMKPLSPTIMAIERDETAQTVTLRWMQRSRLNTGSWWRDYTERSSDPANFDIVLKKGAAEVATVNVLMTEEETFTFAQIAAWYGNSDALISGTIYQVNSATVGRGFGKNFQEEE